MISIALLRELNRWRKKLEKKAATEGLARFEQSDLDFLNDRLPRFAADRRDAS